MGEALIPPGRAVPLKPSDIACAIVASVLDDEASPFSPLLSPHRSDSAASPHTPFVCTPSCVDMGCVVFVDALFKVPCVGKGTCDE